MCPLDELLSNFPCPRKLHACLTAVFGGGGGGGGGGEDPGFFLGGGAPHSVSFCRLPVDLESCRPSQGGAGEGGGRIPSACSP